MSQVAIRLKNVTKNYKLFKDDRARFVSLFLRKKGLFKKKIANSNISLEVDRGESVAILGRNGAGKSTLLKMITGVTEPSAGTIEVNGRVSALLELTAGFDQDFTGRENIYLRGRLLGLNKEEIQAIEQTIIKFAEIGEYIDQPVRTYSSGMKARLGFAINANVDPEILIIDEALSVGDVKFQEKCRQKIEQMMAQQHVTVLLVTHSLDSARAFCQRGIVMHEGMLKYDGEVNDAIKKYKQILAK